MHDWVTVRKGVPDKLDAFDVTIQDGYGGRMVSIAIFRPMNSTWEILVDKHNYQDCKVVAWKPRPEPYNGKV